jgi:N-acetylneuraminic acid mutarotase
MLVFGRHAITALDANGHPYTVKSVNVAAAYDPAMNAWRKLAPPPGPGYSPKYRAVWTGRQMLVLGPFDFEAFNPLTNEWRSLPRAPAIDATGLVVWTGRELIGWGGGCCGDAFSGGVAYNPATKKWRKLASSPLAGSQHPVGTWTGRELLVFVGDFDPNGKPWPARFARAAAYNPRTDKWRRLSPAPGPLGSASGVWDGREVLVVGGAVGLAYSPATNHWRRLPRMSPPRFEAATVWTGKQLLEWGGTTRAGSFVSPSHALAFDPKANRWSPLPNGPLQGRLDATAVWTGHAMIVWGGDRPATPPGSGTKHLADGAAFTPATP